MATTAGNLGLKINIKKTRYLGKSSRNNESTLINGDMVDELITLPNWDLGCPPAEMEKKRS